MLKPFFKILILTSAFTIFFYSFYIMFLNIFFYEIYNFNVIVDKVSNGIYTSKLFYGFFVVFGFILILLYLSKRIKLK